MLFNETSNYDDSFYKLQSADSLLSARIVLRPIFSDFDITSAVDVGCGVGPWLKVASENSVQKILGIDGDYVDRDLLYFPPEHFMAWNLEDSGFSTNLDGFNRFDLAISMEVAEHLSEERASGFVKELCSLSDLVLFSAAVPGQGGRAHINEQPPEYWANLFKQNGFDCHDFLRRSLWDEEDCAWWYLQNVLLFSKCGSKIHRKLFQQVGSEPNPQFYLHPRCLAQKVGEYEQHINELAFLSQTQPFGRDDTIRHLEAKIDNLRSKKELPSYLDPSRKALSRFAARVRNAGRVLRGMPIGR